MRLGLLPIVLGVLAVLSHIFFDWGSNTSRKSRGEATAFDNLISQAIFTCKILGVPGRKSKIANSKLIHIKIK